MTAKVITDPSELANLIEGADRLMLRLGGENSFHKLPDPEAAMIVSALRAMASPGEADQRDAARLDDMERTKCYPFWNGSVWTYIVAPERSSKIERKGVGPTVRAAIDAAMSAQSDTEESK